MSGKLSVQGDPSDPGTLNVSFEADESMAAALASGGFQGADALGGRRCPGSSQDPTQLPPEGLGTGNVLPPGSIQGTPDLMSPLGAAGSQAPDPRFNLPPPQESAQLASQIQEQTGVRITGSGATPDVLEQIQKGLALYDPEHLRGLQGIRVQSTTNDDDPEGSWTSAGEGQGSILLYADERRERKVFRHTVVHELGHHMSLAARPGWGGQFDAALPRQVQTFPSEYSASSNPEKVAENLAFSLLGSESEMQPLPGWRPSEQARQLMQSEFGSRSKI